MDSVFSFAVKTGAVLGLGQVCWFRFQFRLGFGFWFMLAVFSTTLIWIWFSVLVSFLVWVLGLGQVYWFRFEFGLGFGFWIVPFFDGVQQQCIYFLDFEVKIVYGPQYLVDLVLLQRLVLIKSNLWTLWNASSLRQSLLLYCFHLKMIPITPQNKKGVTCVGHLFTCKSMGKAQIDKVMPKSHQFIQILSS